MVLSKNSVVLMLILSCTLLLMVGCDPDPDEPDPTSYILTMQVEGQGTVDPIAGTHEYEEDTAVNITATPAEGSVFKEWDGEVANTGSASTTVLMNKDQTVMAVFEEFDDHVIEFEDENLEQAVRETIGKLEGDLYLSDVIGLEELEARGKGILSLEGIEHLQNLKRLELSHDWNEDTYNYIEDINSLQNLNSLTWLDFGGNSVSDINPLQNLTSLEWLNFGWNQVSDISPLQNLNSLTWLHFGGNQVSDISVLQNLTSLTGLRFGSNQVSDITSFQSLTSLKELDFWGNQVSDISVLHVFCSLKLQRNAA